MSVGNPEIPAGDLRASDSGVRQIVDASPVLACSLTAQLEVEFVSQSLLDYFGKTLDELKNWTSIGVVHPDHHSVKGRYWDGVWRSWWPVRRHERVGAR